MLRHLPSWLLALALPALGLRLTAAEGPLNPSAPGPQGGGGALGAIVEAGRPSHPVVIVVMDGLRPDSVTEADMPNLFRLSQEGTFFANHHAVFISTTEVNGTALATGATPARNGIVSNLEYRPDLDPLLPVEMDGEWAAWKGDQDGTWISVDTLPQIVRESGRRTVVAGTKGVALLWDRSRSGRDPDSPTLFAGETIPGSVKDRIVATLGPIPPATDRRYFVNEAQDRWTTEAMTRVLWSGGDLPALSVLWLSEPDFAQHGTGPGSPLSRAALRSSDDCLGLLLQALEARGQREGTDILVVSDHGFSTISQTVDVITDLARQGFRIGGGFLEKPDPGTIVALPLGGVVNFYVVGSAPDQVARLVRALQAASYAGVLFTRDGVSGTFRLSDAALDGPDAPDVVLSMRWSADRPARSGSPPGTLIQSATSYSPGQGMHGSLSPYDMNNTLIAAGPDFRVGFRSQTPSSNRDVAPTVLRLLGLSPEASMDGRVLQEALLGGTPPPQVETTTLHAEATVGPSTWRQYLMVARVGDERYLLEGNNGDGPAGP